VPGWLAIILLVVGFALVCFLLAGVLPHFLGAKRRRARVEAFLRNFSAYLGGNQGLRGWLSAHSVEMQDDAESVGLGVTYVAPPPMFGGGRYLPHPMFGDLFNRQTYADVVSPAYKREVLLAALHEVRSREAERRRDLLNPMAWVRLAFERLVGFPRYLLRTAGFSERVVDSSAARIITVLWGLLVGAATIGSFVVAVVALHRH
jgi:hypothetical protein